MTTDLVAIFGFMPGLAIGLLVGGYNERSEYCIQSSQKSTLMKWVILKRTILGWRLIGNYTTHKEAFDKWMELNK